MKKLSVLMSFLRNPKEIISLGYQGLVKKKAFVDYEKMLLQKHNTSRLPTINFLDLFPGFHDSLDVYTFLPGTSLITDLLLLKGLAKKYAGGSYLEIGSFRGESLAAVAPIVKDCTSITLSEKEIRELHLSEDLITNNGFFSKNIPNLTTYQSNSQTFDFGRLNGKKFDMIFIDGELSYTAILNDTKNALKLLKNEDSMLIWHEYSLNPERVNHQVLAAMLDAMPAELHGNLYHISNTKCAVLMKGTYNTKMTDSRNHPDKVFKVEVTGRKL